MDTGKRVKVFLSLGTNMGNREKNLQKAFSCLKEEIINVKTSRVYETLPLYVENQPRFLNCVISGETGMQALDLLDYLLNLEKKLGRNRTNVPEKGPRLIDIDILLYNDEIIHNERLHIPHPGIYERQFVLQPLIDLEPDLKDPETGHLFSFFLAKCDNQGISVYKDMLL